MFHLINGNCYQNKNDVNWNVYKHICIVLRSRVWELNTRSGNVQFSVNYKINSISIMLVNNTNLNYVLRVIVREYKTIMERIE